jgi:hypothetical protein
VALWVTNRGLAGHRSFTKPVPSGITPRRARRPRRHRLRAVRPRHPLSGRASFTGPSSGEQLLGTLRRRVRLSPEPETAFVRPCRAGATNGPSTSKR